MKLYEIDQALEEALNKTVVNEETGEVTAEPDFELIEKLQMERDQKIENVCLFYKNASAEAAAIAEEIKKFTARKKALENKAERAKEWVAYVLAGEKFNRPKCSVTYRTTKNCAEVDNYEEIPDEYFPIKKNDRTVSKTLIKNAILAGKKVPGAHLEDHTSTTIS